MYNLSFASTETTYIYFSQVDKLFSLAYPHCATGRDRYGAWSKEGRNTTCFISWPTFRTIHFLLKIIKYIYEGTLTTMTGYVTPTCQHGGLYYAPKQNKAHCTSRAKMWLANDGSAESILIVWLAGYSRGSVLNEKKRKEVCLTRHLDELDKQNSTVLIDSDLYVLDLQFHNFRCLISIIKFRTDLWGLREYK